MSGVSDAKAYKFTAAGGRAAYGSGRWEIGKPRSTHAKPLVPCKAGIHYCRPEHLGWWINDELYEFEDLTPGEAFEHDGSKMVTRKGMLIRRVEAWTPETARTLAFRVADRAVRVSAVSALRSAGFDAEADKLLSLPAIDSPAAAWAARAAAVAAKCAAEYAAWAAKYAASVAGDATVAAEYRWVSGQILDLIRAG